MVSAQGDPTGPGDPRRRVPRTDTVLADPRLVAAVARCGRPAVLTAVRQVLAELRATAAVDTSRPLPPPGAPAAARSDATVAAAAGRALELLPEQATTLTPVLNATGVVLHTNLGRAPLSAAAVAALGAAAGYVDVEFDLATGGRAPRGRGALAALAAALPDAQGVHIVNNGAAALLLAVGALAGGRQVVWSRGEMVEIGDRFRLPDLVAAAGVEVVEVGTTNRTTLVDYQAAVTARTGAILKVHPSNFRISGFTAAVGVAELATLGVPVVADVGSGLLSPDPSLPEEPDMATALRDGASVVTASGDKLLGGPQAGLLAGRAEQIAALRRHPLARALRVDKLTLAALEATLRGPEPPAVAARRGDPELLRARSARVAAAVPGAQVIAAVGAVGGGSGPGVALPGWAVALPGAAQLLVAALRRGEPAVVARVERGRCLLDLRCVPVDADAALGAAALAAVEATGCL